MTAAKPNPIPDLDLQPADELAEVQERVDRLEDAVAALCETGVLEDRIAERVAQRISQLGLSEVPRTTVQVQAVPLPTQEKPPMATFAEISLPSLPPVSQVNPAAGSLRPLTSMLWSMVPDTSLLRDMAWDLRTLVRLVRDPGYLSTWSFKTFPLLILFYVFIWPKVSPFLGWLVPQVSLGLIGVLLDIFLLYIAFKLIHRELRRYDEFARKYRSGNPS